MLCAAGAGFLLLAAAGAAFLSLAAAGVADPAPFLTLAALALEACDGVAAVALDGVAVAVLVLAVAVLFVCVALPAALCAFAINGASARIRNNFFIVLIFNDEQ